MAHTLCTNVLYDKPSYFYKTDIFLLYSCKVGYIVDPLEPKLITLSLDFSTKFNRNSCSSVGDEIHGQTMINTISRIRPPASPYARLSKNA